MSITRTTLYKAMANRPLHDIAVIGAGSLGRSLLTSYVKTYPKLRYMAIVRQKSKLSPLLNTKIVYHGRPFNAEQIMICVKPYQAREVCQAVKNNLKSDTVVISAMAAVSLNKLQSWLDTENIVRIMPSILRDGPIAVYNPRNIKLILPTSNVIQVDNERALELATTTCGCVPGFLAAIMEQMVNAARHLGVKEIVAQTLILKNLQALANEDINTVQDLQRLQSKVATKGGATEKGILELKYDDILANLFIRMFRVADDHVMALRNTLEKVDE